VSERARKALADSASKKSRVQKVGSAASFGITRLGLEGPIYQPTWLALLS